MSQRLVSGPSSATDNAVVRWDSTTGKLVQDSGATIDDYGNVSFPGEVRGGDTTNDFSMQMKKSGAADDANDNYLQTFDGDEFTIQRRESGAWVGKFWIGTYGIEHQQDYKSHGEISSNLAIDLATDGYIHTMTFTGNSAVSFTNVPSGKLVKVVLLPTNGGTYTVTIAGKSLSLTVTGTDLVVAYTVNGGSNWAAEIAHGDIYA